MREIGAEPPLPLERLLQPAEKIIQSGGNGHQLGRKFIGRETIAE